MAATDLDLTVSGFSEARVLKAGATTVPARTLAEMVRELADEEVTVSVTNHRVEIKAGHGVYRMSGMSPDEFPRLPAIPESSAVALPADQLKSMVQRTLYAVSGDETRPALNGILWHVSDDSMHMVATDGHRLARASVAGKIPSREIKDELILPPKAFSLVVKLLSDDIAEVGVTFGEKNVVFRVGDVVITSRLIEGPYPNYQQVIPKEFDKTLRVDGATLAAAVRRVAVLSNALTRQVEVRALEEWHRVIGNQSGCWRRSS